MAEQQSRKRKQPPTFQHYPAPQAKKLKKAWIEKTKIRSKWKAEKKKLQADGVLPVAKKPWEIQEEEEPGPGRLDDEHSSHSDSESEPHIEGRPLPPHLRRPTSPKPQTERPQNPSVKRTKEEIRAPKEQSRWVDKGKAKANLQQEQDNDEPESQQTPSLRDLKREAYSKSHLHSFRSDPLHKHASRRGQPLSQRGRGGGRGNGPGRGGAAGRGQPDMKLRMNYMLEKIKRDFTSDPSQ